ncbi:hypothetical protein F503_06152 [Ophiostoma piceae UAMH 11346]|uniref:Uncharacterized protein n=1 Tax=Ophiostoma piceae (strain UAMH 11346) TaxID=1262450 RepID=S3C7H6_OPHP1|nr:hypothetical protein F503_06152 [Ophiostoma piceae UAMH 11346]
MTSSIIYANISGTPPSITATDGTGDDFKLLAPPKSDIYVSPRTPKALFDYTAPVVHTRIAKEAFVSLSVTASAKWRTQFDQAGLIFTVPTKNNPKPDATNANEASTHPAWVKAGIECNDGAPCISVVGRSPDGWAEWSLIPLSLIGITLGAVVPVTLTYTREKNALMIWLSQELKAGQAPQKLFIRKVPWVFLDDPAGNIGSDVLVGAFAAQPDPYDESKGESLEVTFSGLKIETV